MYGSVSGSVTVIDPGDCSGLGISVGSEGTGSIGASL